MEDSLGMTCDFATSCPLLDMYRLVIERRHDDESEKVRRSPVFVLFDDAVNWVCGGVLAFGMPRF